LQILADIWILHDMGSVATVQEATETPRVSRAERKLQTRQALLSAARVVVARRGMQAATHEEIAAEAGLTIGAIYSNFASKADLMAALMDDVAAKSNVVLEVRPTLQECLSALARRLVEQVDNDPDAVDLQLEFALFAVRNPEARTRRLPHHEEEHRRHADVLARVSAAAGVPLPLPAPEFAEAVSNLAWALMCSRRTLGREAVPDELIERSLGLLAGAAAARRTSRTSKRGTS
jgi:AcrR family transcriptional regulator